MKTAEEPVISSILFHTNSQHYPECIATQCHTTGFFKIFDTFTFQTEPTLTRTKSLDDWQAQKASYDFFTCAVVEFPFNGGLKF